MESAFIIRPARIEDRAALVDLQRRASTEWPSAYRDALLAYPGMIDVAAERIAEGRVAVAVRAGRPIGFAELAPGHNGNAELDGIFVDPTAWRQGIGRALMAAAAQMALELGATALDVIANPQAEGFYRACGFEVTGWTMTRFAPALTMSLALGSGSPSPPDR